MVLVLPLLADTVSDTTSATGLGTNLLNNISVQGGLLGTLLALFILIAVIEAILLLREKDKRIADARKVTDDIALPIERMTSTFKDILDNVKFSPRGRGRND